MFVEQSSSVCIGQEQFHAIDKIVMGHAFDVHNALGRFLDESIYQNELAHRCRASGLEVDLESPLSVKYRDFSKPYYLDMLVEGGVIYELKTVEFLNERHRNQLINCLLLAGSKHGKLINFRPASVESRFVSTTLDEEARKVAVVDDSDWQDSSNQCLHLRADFCALLDAWGCFLDVSLYREALTHFMGGSDIVSRPIQIHVAGRVAGSQKVCEIDDETAWHLSAVKNGIAAYETHMRRFLAHTELKRIQWINLSRRDLTFKTLNKK
ncbi:MAG: GxxExxY protein [Verrucomicrobia bacterium]|nr:GxxExxY protein [Verrucomicrobiota bacterium]